MKKTQISIFKTKVTEGLNNSLKVFFSLEFMLRGTHVNPLCMGKDLWPSDSMANIVTHLWPKY